MNLHDFKNIAVVTCLLVFTFPVVSQTPQTEAAQNTTEDVVTESLLDEKLENEKEANQNLFSLAQHRPNYILPISYVTDPNNITLDGVGAEQIDNLEAKYQISVKTPLWLQQDDASGIYFGFTAVSFWQLYNSETSKPFRETNYEPEVFYQWNANLSLLGYKFNLLRVGINHQSNGQDGLKSRSWNRIVATALFSDENTAYYLKTWYRLPEEDKTSLLDPLGDDNPDINDYYGRIELGFGIKLGKVNVVSRIRNNLSFKDNRSGIELDFTYPINERYDFLIQYFNGYGDSLIDYNRHQQRFSMGVQLRFL
ncbi:phospholipase A [Glaciecola petra]|uniref:Phospholipase A1 n=1 Tax=Glaciecola petra TaxID=3075602 RepID=A0ABU2ZT84_9ALTE|nr:phospholipase A [Aestuariibacter sp. P117]MDT0595857.1 phospholipase A [Aestuariibacter sp. P117]